ncbi:MAG: ParA family protein [Oscillospiraceae bacterium]|nr:ParA family protein [Oscillospiraceae bacterium]
METLRHINFALSVLFMACYAYQFLYIPVPWLKKAKPHAAPRANRYAVLICARNEAAVIGDLIASIRLCSSRLNKRLRIEGILLTMYDGRANLTLQVESELRRYMPDKVYQTVIPRSVRLSEAPSHGLPGVVYDRNNKGSSK